VALGGAGGVHMAHVQNQWLRVTFLQCKMRKCANYVSVSTHTDMQADRYRNKQANQQRLTAYSTAFLKKPVVPQQLEEFKLFRVPGGLVPLLQHIPYYPHHKPAESTPTLPFRQYQF